MTKYGLGTGNVQTGGNPFRPSLLAVMFYLLLGLTVLAVLNFRVIWHALLAYSTDAASQASLYPLTDNLLDFMKKLNTPLLMLFWAVIGAFIYSLIWLAQNVFYTVEKEIEESRYIQPSSTPTGTYWHQTLRANLSFIGILAAWVIYFVIFLRVLLPLASSLFYDAFYEYSIYKILLDAIGAVLISSVGLYALWTIQYLTATVWRSTKP